MPPLTPPHTLAATSQPRDCSHPSSLPERPLLGVSEPAHFFACLFRTETQRCRCFRLGSCGIRSPKALGGEIAAV
eukprot:892599-Rhodomonas_salina.2